MYIHTVYTHTCINTIIHFYKQKIFNFISFRPFLRGLATYRRTLLFLASRRRYCAY